jgi:hypothetical protein
MKETEAQQIERQLNQKVRFDGTITLGNVLTMFGMICTIVALWRNMESRVLIVEERQHVQAKALDRLVENVERLALVQAAMSRNTIEGRN